MSPEEAIKRMKRRNTDCVRWSKDDIIIEYRYIRATAARNWDGSSAGSGNDPNQIILQRMTWETGCYPRFSNYW